MNKWLSIFVVILLLISCATSNINVSQETKNKIDSLRNLVLLSDKQVKKLEVVEAQFLRDYNSIIKSVSFNEEFERLNKKRLISYKKVLTKRQYTQFKAIENKLIKDVPIRS